MSEVRTSYKTSEKHTQQFHAGDILATKPQLYLKLKMSKRTTKKTNINEHHRRETKNITLTKEPSKICCVVRLNDYITLLVVSFHIFGVLGFTSTRLFIPPAADCFF